MKPKKSTKATRAPRSWLITALLASLAVSYVAFVFVPAQVGISSLGSKLNERRQHILQADSLVLPVEHAARQLATTRQVSISWQDSAPNPGELATSMAQLSAEAKAAGVAIERFDPQPPSDLQVLSLHGVDVHLRGTFAQVFDFVRRVEQLPGTIWIPSIRFASEAEADSTLRCEMKLTIFVDRIDSADSANHSVR
ncbi:MAG: type 4a pilus biogenesis protein PilO [Pirellulaceae bacterium]